MKELLEKLNPHRQTILADMQEVGYSKVYIAEPMTNRPSTELTFLVEAKDEDSLPSPVSVDSLRGKIEKLMGVPSCMILDKFALEEKIQQGVALDRNLYGKTLKSARLLTLAEEKPLLPKEATPVVQPKRELLSETTDRERISPSNSSLTIFSVKKVARNEKNELLEVIIKQLYANAEVAKIIRENPHILREVDKQLTSSSTEYVTIPPRGVNLSTES